MPDLQTALSTHHQAAEIFLAAARAIPESQWSRPRLPGRWPPGLVAEHVALAYEVNRGVLHGRAAAATAPRFLRPWIRRFALQPVLRRGRFIPGSTSPKAFRPGNSPAPPAMVLERLQAAIAGFEADAAAAGAATIEHSFFGRLPLVDFVRLQEIHTEHHHRQLLPGPG